MDINNVTIAEKNLRDMGFSKNKKTGKYTANIIIKNGILTSSQQKCISNASNLFGDNTTKISTSFTIGVSGIPYEKINDFLDYISKENLEIGGIGPKIRPIVSCSGPQCRYCFENMQTLLDEIDEKIYAKYKHIKLPSKFKIGISGCPNDCAKIDLCEIGIISQYVPNFQSDLCRGCKVCSMKKQCTINALSIEDEKIKKDNNKCDNCGRCVNKCPFKVAENYEHGYKIFMGGKAGRVKISAKTLDQIITSKEELLDLIEEIILFYIENAEEKERFSNTIERIGFDKLKESILKKDKFREENHINYNHL